LETRGFRVNGGAGRAAEEWFAGPGGGTKGGTFVDITATNGTQTVRIQTVTTLADGVTPTVSEAAAAARIRARFPNDQLILVSKQTGQVIP
jgi:filamentous hemagglutinin